MKIHYYLSAVFVLLFCGFQKTNAQQWHSYNPTAWFDINAVEIPGPGVIAIGGGQEANNATQIMFQTIDYGLTWTENPHDGLAPWNKSIAFSDSVNGYGVGYEGRIIRTDDAGLNWGYSVYPINRDLNKIVYAGNGTYYVAGGNRTNDSIQTILKSNDYGNTWNVIYDTLGPWLKSIFFTDTLKGFAVGDNGVILSTANGGNTWAAITAPVQRDFNAITFLNADTGYIVGGTPSGLCRRTILRTINGGANWAVLRDNVGGILKDISFADAMEGYTVGDSATILKTMDRGLNWFPIVIDTNLSRNESFNAVKFNGLNFGAIAGKTGVLYVYHNPPVEIFTLGLGQIGNTDATLLGGINTHTKNARYSFVYSTNINFATSITNQGINVQNDSLLLIYEHIQGLTPNTIYYYYLTAITDTDTICGDTLSFYTGVNPSSVFQTLDATTVRDWTADLNGFINKFPVPVNLFFEYGNTPSFGSQIAASPATLNDTSMYNVHANIVGLHANNRYFFRLKGVSGSGTFYGDTKMFTAVNLTWVGTENASNITLISAQLHGNEHNNGLPTALKFDYGQTVLYGTEINATPDSATGAINVYTSCLLTGLSPLTIYHFRMKAINSMGTSYGRDMTFITGGPSASTFPASNINANSAQLNAIVNANNKPTLIKFEYGLTNTYGTEVTANPDSAFGTLNTNASIILGGLISDTTYHFRVKVINSIATIYGDDMSFFTTNMPILTTLPASPITYNSVQLNALVNANNNPSAIIFEWGLTTSYGFGVIANPDSAFNTVNINASYYLNSLQQNTTYHYRVKVICSLGTFYGNDIAFQTGHTFPTVVTLMANEISYHSAKLNAILNPRGTEVNIGFDYGLTDFYGNEIIANPASSSDTIDLNVSAALNGLISSTLYHFRIKAITPNDTIFGNDMIFFTGHSEIPNFDFEVWDSTIIDFPDDWTMAMGNVTKYSPGCDGSYAIKIQNTPTGGTGLISMGFVGDGIFGGVPFYARPDSLIGCFNYNIDANDTSFVGLLLKKDGNPVSMNFYPIVGNSGGNFVNLKFPIQYETSDMPDSMILLLSSSNLSQKTPSPNSWLIADNLHFTGISLNIANNNFEQWHNEKVLDLSGWDYKSRGMTPSDTNGISGAIRTTDAISNTFAAKVKTFLRPDFMAYGRINSGNKTSDKIPMNARHQSLTGYYKFSPQNGDTMCVSISMFKNGIVIGRGDFLQKNAISSYTPFIADISYSSSDIPDSASIYIQSFYRFPPLGNSVLYIDNLNFDGFFTGIKEHSLTANRNFDFNVFPNPFSDEATVTFTMNQDDDITVRLFDLSGKQIALLADGRCKEGNHRLQLSALGLQKGLYICVITANCSNLSKKIIIY